MVGDERRFTPGGEPRLLPSGLGKHVLARFLEERSRPQRARRQRGPGPKTASAERGEDVALATAGAADHEALACAFDHVERGVSILVRGAVRPRSAPPAGAASSAARQGGANPCRSFGGRVPEGQHIGLRTRARLCEDRHCRSRLGPGAAVAGGPRGYGLAHRGLTRDRPVPAAFVALTPQSFDIFWAEQIHAPRGPRRDPQSPDAREPPDSRWHELE